MLSHDEISAKVKKVIIDALGVDDDEVVPHASIRNDLGAESIDWLDITFRLEKEFGIKIPQTDLPPRWREFEINDRIFDKDGALTDEGKAKLHELYTDVNFSDVGMYPGLEDIKGAILRVEYLEKYITLKLQEAESVVHN